MSTEYFALVRCKTFELLSWPLLLWSRRIRSVVLYALFTRVVLEAPERIPERIFLGRGLAYVLRSP